MKSITEYNQKIQPGNTARKYSQEIQPENTTRKYNQKIQPENTTRKYNQKIQLVYRFLNIYIIRKQIQFMMQILF